MWLFEVKKAAQFADIETRIGLTRTRKGNTAISHDPLKHPVNRGLQLITGPNPVDFTLFRLASSVATAAHGGDIGLFCHVALHTSVTYRGIHSHDHCKGVRVMGCTPVISQMVRLQHITHAVNQIRREGRLMQWSRCKGHQAFGQSFFCLHKSLGLIPIFGLFEVAFHLTVIKLFPPHDVFGIRAAGFIHRSK